MIMHTGDYLYNNRENKFFKVGNPHKRVDDGFEVFRLKNRSFELYEGFYCPKQINSVYWKKCDLSTLLRKYYKSLIRKKTVNIVPVTIF